MIKQIIDTWNINNRVNLMLLDGISPEALNFTLSSRGGGTPAKQFAHLHNVRLYRLKESAKDIYREQTIISLKENIKKELLKQNLVSSGLAIEKWLEKYTDKNGNLKGFKRGVVAFLGYIISHESHHRGNIILTLKQCGYKLPKEITYGIWSWNNMGL
ncbi:MAG: hypothetical protein CO128_09915 [Ignavibacteriales bacterium CG_4_9_14_3_um_filter_30_11]|nr:MAG: hypothetical protein CO128_09915 [Ignavibacteriales bacterium CG_4_9_14_3_um_filter_30_11]